MQIPELVSSLSAELLCGFCCLFTIGFLFVKLVALITGWHLLGIAILLYGFYKLLRNVGTFALYPACFNYIKAENQIRGSQRVAQHIIKSSQQFFGLIHRCDQHPESSHLTPIYFVNHVQQMINMLQKFQNTLSHRKKQILRIYRFLDEILKNQYSVKNYSISIQKFLSDPLQFRKDMLEKQGNANQVKNIANFIKEKASPYVRELHNILMTYNPPVSGGLIKSFMYRVKEEKLYEIRFGYIYWDQKFQYSIHLVQSKQSDAVLECAVIKGHKGQAIESKKSVLISCPNGAYIQYFALESQYINMYLQMGYQIILWNYRGYGQSTGSPTISQSLKDVEAIYNYSKRVLQLEPQISHGYSIGGPPAVHVAATHPFKILIVDRSFCNFVNIAHQISPILAKLAKIVMSSDSNINISDLYMKIKETRKILIWSPVDEVISNGSSLKLGILKKMLNKPQIRQLKQAKQISENQNSFVQEQINQNQKFIKEKNSPVKNIKVEEKLKIFNVWFDKSLDFFRIVSMLHEAEKNYQQTFVKVKNIDEGFNNSLIEQVSTELASKGSSETIWKKQEHRRMLKKIWDIIEHIDGGGTKIRFLRELAEQGIQKQKEMNLEVKSFIYGLIYFGCSYHENEKLDRKTLNNWTYTMYSLKTADEELRKILQQFKNEGPQELMRYIKEFHSTLRQINNYIQKYQKDNINQLGIVVPTNSGHNGDLSADQFQYLKAAISMKSHIQGQINAN